MDANRGRGNGPEKKGFDVCGPRGIFLLYGRFTLGVVGVTGGAVGLSLGERIWGLSLVGNIGGEHLGSGVLSALSVSGEEARIMCAGIGYGIMYCTMFAFP